MPIRLEVDGLKVHAGAREVLRGVSFTLAGGEVVGLVGASGSGKSLCTRALLGLLPVRPGRTAGDIRLQVDGRALAPRTEADFATLRGGVLGLLFQDARAALNPLWTVGRHVREAATLAGTDPDPRPWLERAGLPDPSVASRYPHELSGGMAQRAAIALGLARQSRILLADEPTTGLDPTVQRGILAQLRAVADAGTGVLFITHDLRVLPGFADRVLVMDEGRIVEEASRPSELVGAGRALMEATARVAGGVL